MFEYNSYAIKKDAKPLLDTLAKALGNVLADADVRANIDTIVIQGHTDERGSASLQLGPVGQARDGGPRLPLRREHDARRLVRKLLRRQRLFEVPSDQPGKTEAAYQQNRRIEIAVIPKDDNVRKVIDDYMRSAAQAPPPATP